MHGDARDNAQHLEQTQALLAEAADDGEEEDSAVHPTSPSDPSTRQASFTRSVHGHDNISLVHDCVHNDVEQILSGDNHTEAHETEGMGAHAALENALTQGERQIRGCSNISRASRMTRAEAASVAGVTGLECEDAHYDYYSGSKGGMHNAFVNMANSIIGAGIIGQPYAFKQAGLITGMVLLVGLTITVDWTIRLIVINSKLSGTDSFQSTMEHVFGSPGLIIISIAQWAFAFGGMIAFCIIVGDTIPQVLESFFPSLPTTRILWLLTNRRAVIMIFILGVSYPLSLYRDITKVS